MIRLCAGYSLCGIVRGAGLCMRGDETLMSYVGEVRRKMSVCLDMAGEERPTPIDSICTCLATTQGWRSSFQLNRGTRGPSPQADNFLQQLWVSGRSRCMFWVYQERHKTLRTLVTRPQSFPAAAVGCSQIPPTQGGDTRSQRELASASRKRVLKTFLDSTRPLKRLANAALTRGRPGGCENSRPGSHVQANENYTILT